MNSIFPLINKNSYFDLSKEFAVLKLNGSESLDLLNRLTTNSINTDNKYFETCFLSIKGRIISASSIIVNDNYNEVYILTAQGCVEKLLEHIVKYIILEDIEVKILPLGSFNLFLINSVDNFAGMKVGTSVMTILFDEFKSGSRAFGSLSKLSEENYTELCIKQIVGRNGLELTTKYNPLEADLLPLIDFNKGCYIGQEVVARLNTYDKVQRKLIGITADVQLQPNDLIKQNFSTVGEITSACRIDSHKFMALGYVKIKFIDKKTDLVVNDKVVKLHFCD